LVLTEVAGLHGLARKATTDASGPDGASKLLDEQEIPFPVLVSPEGVVDRLDDVLRGREGIRAVLEQKLDHVPLAGRTHDEKRSVSGTCAYIHVRMVCW
jgi:hypothetical protein